VAAVPETGTAFLAEYRRRMDSQSVLKGQVISLVMDE